MAKIPSVRRFFVHLPIAAGLMSLGAALVPAPVLADSLSWRVLPLVPALAETPPVGADGDAADDPAIYVDTAAPAQSLVIGTQKQGGLYLYDLAGQELQFVPAGRLNNVDLRAGVPLGPDGSELVLVGASNRTDQSVTFFRLDPATRQLSSEPVGRIATGFTEVYGFCFYRDGAAGHLFAIATDKSGPMRQWRLSLGPDGQIAGELVRVVSFASITEGCVADDTRGVLFVAEENTGIWRLSARPDVLDGAPYGDDQVSLIAPVGPTHGLTADVEGLTLVETGPETGYLIASSQGDSSFVVFTRDGARRLGAFRIGPSAGVDGVTETDGIAATAVPLGPDYPFGLLVVQDDENTDPAGMQNFKYVSIGDVLITIPTE